MGIAVEPMAPRGGYEVVLEPGGTPPSARVLTFAMGGTGCRSTGTSPSAFHP